MTKILTCAHCRSANIQRLAWVTINDPDLPAVEYVSGDDLGSHLVGQAVTWCADCDTHPPLVERAADDYDQCARCGKRGAVLDFVDRTEWDDEGPREYSVCEPCDVYLDEVEAGDHV